MYLRNIAERITVCLIAAVAGCSICLGPAAAHAQISPKEAQRILREKQRLREEAERNKPATDDDAKPADNDTADTDADSAIWPAVALRSASYICQVGEAVVCNANFNPRFTRTCWRAAGKPTVSTKNSFKVKLGEMVTTIDSRGNTKRTPIFYEITHKRPADEQFAQTKSIGPPELDEFGFIDHARVAQIVDDHTVVLDNIRLLAHSDFQDEYKKQKDIGRVSSYYYYRDDPRYDLRTVISNTVKAPRNSYFDESLPTPAELYQQRVKMIEWEYEGRLATVPAQQAWTARRLKVIGMPTATLHVGQTWRGPETQLAIVAVNGRHVTAVPTSQLIKPVPRDQMIALMQKRGFTADSMNQAIRHIASHRVAGQSTERRIAFLLAARPLADDAQLLPAALASEIAAESADGALPGTASAATGGSTAQPNVASGAAAAPATGLFDVQNALITMVSDTVGQQSRQIDDLLASAFADWWRKKQGGKTVEISGLFTGAYRVEPNTYLTDHLIIRQRCSRARFALGKVNVRSGTFHTISSDDDDPPTPTGSRRTYVTTEGFDVGPYHFRVSVQALFSGDREMAPLKLSMPAAGQPVTETIVRGKVADARFFSSGTCIIYLQDAELPQ